MDDTTDSAGNLRFRPVGSLSQSSLMGDFWDTYRHLLKRPVGTPLSVLMEERALPENTIREHIEHLCAIGVAQGVPDYEDAWVPISPEHTLRNHLEAERHKALMLQAELDDLHSLTYSLISDYHDSRIAPNNDYISHVMNAEDERRLQNHVLSHLSKSARYTCPFRPSKEILQEAKAFDTLLFATGAKLSGLYLTSAASDPHMISYLNWMCEEGAEIRLSPTIAFYCQIIDDMIVFGDYGVGSNHAGKISTAVPELVRLYNFAFDRMWEMAEPYKPTTRRGLATPANNDMGTDQSISAVERALLHHLADGKKDESAARSLNVSVRTVRRIVADLCERCGVSSRFELAIYAERNGWLG